MPKRARPSNDFDSPWKDALQAFFPAFLALFYADIHADINWERGYEALDKEFQQIVRHAKIGKRLADKLFKVWLRDGSEYWLLEIQAEPEEGFEQRMFDYHCAVRKLYDQEVISLAVLCDDQPEWQPVSFSYGRWGCRMELTFRSVKILDYAAQAAELEADSNPIAAIVLAQLQAIQTRHDPHARRQAKSSLVKSLLKRGQSKEDVRQLFRLIDWLMSLPDDLEAAFLAEIHQFEEENKMEWLSSIERRGYQKGKEEGERTGLLMGISLLWGAKFGTSGSKLLKKVHALRELKDLREFAEFLKNADTINEVRDYLR